MSIKEIKIIRNETGIGLKSAQKVLEAADGDLEKALDCVKEEGRRIAFQRTAKPTKASTIGFYVHGNQKIVAMVEVSCESDLTAASDFFNEFANRIAMHIAANESKYISRKDVPCEILEDIPANKLNEFYKKNCLLEQAYVCDESITISDFIFEFIYKHKENVEINRFSCYTSRREL